MRGTSIFPFIMSMVSNFMIFFYLSQIYLQVFLYKYNRFLHFHMIRAALLLITCYFVNNIFFFKKIIIFIACSLKDLQKFFMQSLPLYTSYLFSMLLNDNIVAIEKPDGTCQPTFVVDEFSGLSLHTSILSINLSRST